MNIQELTKDEVAALSFLDSDGGGFTSGAIARHCGRARDRIDMAGFRSGVVMRLLAQGLVDKMDGGKPALFVLTEAGRATLKARSSTTGTGGRNGN